MCGWNVQKKKKRIVLINFKIVNFKPSDWLWQNDYDYVKDNLHLVKVPCMEHHGLIYVFIVYTPF